MDNQGNLIAEQSQLGTIDNTWTSRVLAIGAVLGAGTGLVAALLLVQRSKKLGERPTIELGELIKLGLWLFGLLRNVAMLADHSE
jgi:hypothetical protein